MKYQADPYIHTSTYVPVPINIENFVYQQILCFSLGENF
jgi:hypothetical protein